MSSMGSFVSGADRRFVRGRPDARRYAPRVLNAAEEQRSRSTIGNWGVETTQEGIRAHGEIDVAVADDFFSELCASLVAARTPFVVDMRDVTFIDSVGLSALICVMSLTKGADMVIQTSPQVFRILDIAGVTMSHPWKNVVVVPPDGTRS
jgi:anti-anti-sigma factor